MSRGLGKWVGHQVTGVGRCVGRLGRQGVAPIFVAMVGRRSRSRWRVARPSWAEPAIKSGKKNNKQTH